MPTKTVCDRRAVRLPAGEPREGEWFPSEGEAVEIDPEQNTLAKSIITKYILVAGWGWDGDLNNVGDGLLMGETAAFSLR